MTYAERIAEALAKKPGSNVINGGRKRRHAQAFRAAYARARKLNGGKLGRYTPPRPRPRPQRNTEVVG